MNVPSHVTGQLPWPQWAYVPGETGAVEADDETLRLAKALVPSAFRGHVPARHPALRYGLALNDRGYFWEAQEVLEAVWAAAPQGGRVHTRWPARSVGARAVRGDADHGASRACALEDGLSSRQSNRWSAGSCFPWRSRRSASTPRATAALPAI